MKDIENYLEEIKKEAVLERLTVTANMIKQSTKGLSKVSEDLSNLILNHFPYLDYTTREEVQMIAKKNVYYYDNFVTAINRYLEDIERIYELINRLEKLLDEN